MSDDDALQQAVLAELRWEPSVTAAHIGVVADGGVVTLTGHVDSFAAKHAAEDAAKRVNGVRALAGDIEVRLAFERRRDDGDIAAAALERLAWDVAVPTDSITVNVADGWVTIAGHVEWFYQKTAAEQDIRGLIGVVGLSNQIVVRARVDASGVGDQIMHALHRSWFFDETTIKVTAQGGNIRLTGTVASPHERQLAAQTAWAAPGATSVENELVIV